MLDLKTLRQRPEEVMEALKRRGFDLDLKLFQTLEEGRKRLQSETETLQNQRNTVSRAIGKAKAGGADVSTLVLKWATLESVWKPQKRRSIRFKNAHAIFFDEFLTFRIPVCR